MSSTEVYAKQDTDLIEFMLSAANSYIRNNGVSLRDLAVEYYDRQLAELESEIQKLEKMAA
ncbi:hypothetical protein QJ367_001227 [Vibrio vulnificus]|nr:hypothetical protein [Vibrio vulnificus]